VDAGYGTARRSLRAEHGEQILERVAELFAVIELNSSMILKRHAAFRIAVGR